jgi:hypothetical protein
MINTFNHCFISLIKPDSPVAFATAFYDYIDPLSEVITDSISTDGVHWHNQLGSEFMDKFIVPAMEYGGYHLSHRKYELMSNYRYQLALEPVKEQQLYDTWVRGQVLGVRTMEYAHEIYSLLPAVSSEKLGVQLTLIRG